MTVAVTMRAGTGRILRSAGPRAGHPGSTPPGRRARSAFLRQPDLGRSAILEERRDVDLVVGDLQRGALAVIHAHIATARRGRSRGPRLLGERSAVARGLVEAGGDDRHPHLVAE